METFINKSNLTISAEKCQIFKIYKKKFQQYFIYFFIKTSYKLMIKRLKVYSNLKYEILAYHTEVKSPA